MLRRTLYLSRLIVVASVAVVSLASQRAQVAPKPFVLERGRAGQFEIGMTVDELYKVVGREQVHQVTSHRGAESRPAMDVRIPGFTAGPAALRVSLDRICTSLAAWWIEVHDPRFRTSNGLGVGSTLGDLRRLYPNANVVGIDTDDGAHVAINELGLWFELELAATFTDSTRVVTVSVLPQTRIVKARRCPDQLR